MPEAANAPSAEDPDATPRERKIPDFQFSYLDDLEPDPDASAKHFVVECKRLGPPDPKRWVLTDNYVDHGVLRFRERTHGYGMGAESGAMVGFVQGRELDDLLADVNRRATAVGVDELSPPSAGWKEGGVSSMEQSFTRGFRPSPFRLEHRWLDIRSEANEHARTAAARARRRPDSPPTASQTKRSPYRRGTRAAGNEG